MSKTDSHELQVLINLDAEDQEEEPRHVDRASTPMVIRKKMETFEKVGAREVDAFVDAAMGSETEKEKVKRTCFTETTDADSRARSNSFHFSAKHGFTEVVTRMMAMGFTKLLSDDSKSPVEVAVEEKHYDTAEVLLRRMDKKRAIKLFKCCGEDKPRISLFELLNNLGDLQEKDEEKALQLQQFLLAVLDTTVSEQKVDLELLEADENGKIPTEESFEKGPDATTCYSIIVFRKLGEIQRHESFGALVEKKWINYGHVAQCLIFAVYMTTITFLTISLVLAARSSDPNDYSRPIDGFRLFCEIITFFLVLLDTFLEVKDFYQTYKNSEEHKSPCCGNTGCQYFWSAVKEHAQSAPNWLDFFALLTVWLIIPCRIADSDWQWVFAAITYILHGLRIFKHAIMFWSVAVYVRILLKIITRDLIQFILVMVVVLIAFGGGLYFALRGRTHTPDSGSGSGSDEFDPVDDTDLGLFPDDTKEIYLAWLTGFRILTEGSVLDYYGKDGPGEYGVLGAFIYWLFVFTVTIILLSLLIAQFSVSFEEHKEIAEEDVLISRMELLQQIHIIFNLWPINKICCCCPQKIMIQNTFLLKKLQTISGKIRQQYRWIFGKPEFKPDLHKVERSESKAQKSRGKYKLVARQERLEVETLQCTVQEIWKILKDMQPKDAPDKE